MAHVAPAHIPTAGSHLGLAIAEIVVAVCLLGLSAYEEAAYDSYYSPDLGANILSGAIGFTLFASIFSLLVLIYFMITTRRVYAGYHSIAYVSLLAVTAAFWLISWALLAALMSVLNTPYTLAEYDYYSGGIVYKTVRYSAATLAIYGATLALAIIEMILFIVSAILVGRAPRTPSAAATATPATYESGYAKGHETAYSTAGTTTAPSAVSPITTTAPTTHTAAPTYETLPHAAIPDNHVNHAELSSTR